MTTRQFLILHLDNDVCDADTIGMRRLSYYVAVVNHKIIMHIVEHVCTVCHINIIISHIKHTDQWVHVE